MRKVADTGMIYQFHRWIITLEAEVRALHERLLHENPKSIQKSVKRYKSELQLLYEYAQQHKIDLIVHHHTFAEIEQHLILIHQQLSSAPHEGD